MLDLIDPCKLQVLKHHQVLMNCHYYNGWTALTILTVNQAISIYWLLVLGLFSES